MHRESLILESKQYYRLLIFLNNVKKIKRERESEERKKGERANDLSNIILDCVRRSDIEWDIARYELDTENGSIEWVLCLDIDHHGCAGPNQ